MRLDSVTNVELEWLGSDWAVGQWAVVEASSVMRVLCCTAVVEMVLSLNTDPSITGYNLRP